MARLSAPRASWWPLPAQPIPRSVRTFVLVRQGDKCNQQLRSQGLNAVKGSSLLQRSPWASTVRRISGWIFLKGVTLGSRFLPWCHDATNMCLQGCSTRGRERKVERFVLVVCKWSQEDERLSSLPSTFYCLNWSRGPTQMRPAERTVEWSQQSRWPESRTTPDMPGRSGMADKFHIKFKSALLYLFIISTFGLLLKNEFCLKFIQIYFIFYI